MQLLAGEADEKVILASSAGYGFVNMLGNLDTNQKAGKNIINFADDATLLDVVTVQSKDLEIEDDNGNTLTKPAHDQLAVATSAGYLLVFSLEELPEQARGKGNKLINLKDDEEVVAITPLHHTDSLTITAGKRHVTLKPNDLANYTGKRGNRGSQLPRGFQGVSGIRVAE